MSLFEASEEANRRAAQPLAARMRPESLDEFVGQRHFLGEEKLLRRLLKADHLARVAEIRESIHLRALANLDPLDEFHKALGREFADLLERIDEQILITFQSAEISKDGLDLDKEGLRGPSSTWTYMISDNPFGDVLQRLFRGLKRKLIEESKLGDS